MRRERNRCSFPLASWWLVTALFGSVLMPSTAAAQVADNQTYTFLLFDQLEYRHNTGPGTLRWDVQGWAGHDYNKFWVKTEGEQATRHGSSDAEVQALYSRLVGPFWYFQTGVRVATRYGSGPSVSRSFLVVAFQGLAPYRFDVEPALFIGTDGHVLARFTSTYDVLLTQRLILQPRFEVNAAAQRVAKLGLGAGLNNVELGARLRYEFRRQFAPYVGVSWVQTVGSTATIARQQGGDVRNLAVVVGVRLWM